MLMNYEDIKEQVAGPQREKDRLSFLNPVEIWIRLLEFLELPLAYYIMDKWGDKSPRPSTKRGVGSIVPVFFQILLIVTSAPVFPPTFYCESFQVFRQVGRMCGEHPYTLHLDSTVNISPYLLRYIYPLYPSIFISRHMIDISTLRSYTLNVRVIKIRSIFAYGLLPGTFFFF